MQLKRFITVILAIAAIAAPAARADDGTLLSSAATTIAPQNAGAAGPYITRAPTIADLSSTGITPKPAVAIAPQNQGASGPATKAAKPATRPPRSSYIGHPGGSRAAGPIVAVALERGGGFHWGDAGIGGGFVAGIIAFAAGAATMLRRRRVPAHSH